MFIASMFTYLKFEDCNDPFKIQYNVKQLQHKMQLVN